MLAPQVTRYPVLFRADLDRGFLFNMLGVDVFRGVDVFCVRAQSVRLCCCCSVIVNHLLGVTITERVFVFICS